MPETCKRCQGNGEIVTDWERYLHGPLDGDGNDSVAECPDCDGTGEACDVQSPDLWVEERRVHVLTPAGLTYMRDHENAPSILRKGDYITDSDVTALAARATHSGLTVTGHRPVSFA